MGARSAYRMVTHWLILSVVIFRFTHIQFETLERDKKAGPVELAHTRCFPYRVRALSPGKSNWGTCVNFQASPRACLSIIHTTSNRESGHFCGLSFVLSRIRLTISRISLCSQEISTTPGLESASFTSFFSSPFSCFRLIRSRSESASARTVFTARSLFACPEGFSANMKLGRSSAGCTNLLFAGLKNRTSAPDRCQPLVDNSFLSCSPFESIPWIDSCLSGFSPCLSNMIFVAIASPVCLFLWTERPSWPCSFSPFGSPRFSSGTCQPIVRAPPPLDQRHRCRAACAPVFDP